MAKLSRIGQYKLVRKLGQGGMGMVFEGLQESLDRRVAIKILPADFMRDPAFVERFQREAKAAARLNHPNIVTIYEIGDDQGFHFFSMELVDGQSLQQRLEECGRLDVAEVLDLIRQSIHGLSHAWEQQIVHRDIKPDNLMLTKAGLLKITDLGLARVRDKLGTMTQTGAGMGTPYYMSPEQAQDAKNVDLRSDVYSLGATFYHLLTGRVPFEGSSPFEVVIKVATASFSPICELRPDVPTSVAAVIEKMLAREPQHRFQNAAELQEAVESFHRSPQPAASVSAVAVRATAPVAHPVVPTVQPAATGLDLAKLAADKLAQQRVKAAATAKAQEKAQQDANELQLKAQIIADQSYDYATAARMLDEIDPRWRDAKLYEKICGDRDQVQEVEASIQDSVQKGRLQWLRGRIQELLKLQPNREDMQRLLDVLPDDPELPKKFTNSIGMRFVLIQPRQFMMGSNERYQQPPHLVRITQPFYLGVFPVTQAEYQAVTGLNPSVRNGNPSHPVENVSWEDAVAYAQKLSQLSPELKHGLTYRLPSEAEWEYACRAGSAGKWCFGDQESTLRDYAWFGGWNVGTHPVGEKKPNGWGLHDMYGNVSEWCLDWFEADYYKVSPTFDPKGPSSSSLQLRVLRGGSCGHEAPYCCSAWRFTDKPKSRSAEMGFRLAAVPE